MFKSLTLYVTLIRLTSSSNYCNVIRTAETNRKEQERGKKDNDNFDDSSKITKLNMIMVIMLLMERNCYLF